MPNVKLYIDQDLLAAKGKALSASLNPLRDLLCRDLKVDVSACQFAVFGVQGLPDQPAANVELLILPKTERTREVVTATCTKVQALVGKALQARVAVRAAMLDAQTYVALK